MKKKERKKERGRGKLEKCFKAKIRLFWLSSAYGFGKNYCLCNFSLHK